MVILIKYFGRKQSIVIGLAFQVLQLTAYAFSAQSWLIWFAGMLAAVSSIGYPAISAYISNHSHADQQGVSQGMVTGIRGLCNGIGPALYGFIFWIFRVSLNETSGSGSGSSGSNGSGNHPDSRPPTYASTHFLPGPPFLFGAVLALLAIFVTWFIPSSSASSSSSGGHKRTSSILIPTTSATNTTGSAINGNTSANNLINSSQTGNKLLDLSSTSSSPSNTIIKMGKSSFLLHETVS